MRRLLAVLELEAATEGEGAGAGGRVDCAVVDREGRRCGALEGVPGLTFSNFTPFFFRVLMKPLFRVMVVVPLATGSLAAEAKGANASSANSAAT